jgi:hypothetical protein
MQQKITMKEFCEMEPLKAPAKYERRTITVSKKCVTNTSVPS